jgi:hypothetical protein
VQQESGIQRLVGDREQVMRKYHFRRRRPVAHPAHRAGHRIAPRGHRQLTVEVAQTAGAAHRYHGSGHGAGLELGDPGQAVSPAYHDPRHHQHRAARGVVEGETGEGDRAAAGQTYVVVGI